MYSFVVLNCLKFARRCKRYLKLRRIRTKMAVRLKWEELSGRKLAGAVQRGYAALSRASRRLPMSRGHKLTLGTNARESRLARRRRRRRTALSCDASGGLKTAGLHLYWLAALHVSFPQEEELCDKLIVRDMTPCTQVEILRSSRGMCSLYIQRRRCRHCFSLKFL